VEITNLQKSALTNVKVQRNDFWSFQMFALSLFSRQLICCEVY
jgi:hypothetical protein